VETTPVTAAARRLRSGALPELAALLNVLGLTDAFTGDAAILGDDPLVASPHRLATASATALLLGGAAAAAVWAARTGRHTDLSIDAVHALHHLHPTHFVTQQGHPMNVGAEHVAANGVFPTRDGGFVMIEAGPPYPKLLDGYLAFFHCPNTRAALQRRIAEWDAGALEDALAIAGLPGCRAFTREEWLTHPQGRALSDVPVIEIEKLTDGDPVPWPANRSAPLSGMRVLDFTHVLAGPRSTQTLAEYGAEVLHVSSPRHPDTLAQHLCVDHGKRCAYLDLTQSHDAAAMRTLLADADVFASTYRPGVTDRFALSAPEVAAASRRGVVYMSATAYGYHGPWATRPGFDQNAQVATGFAMTEGKHGIPRFSPVFYLADLVTGHLAAAGIIAALRRRATEGGSYHVRVSLARSAMWVQDLGYVPVHAGAEAPATEERPARLSQTVTAYGSIRHLSPALSFTDMPLTHDLRLVPYGADPPQWQ
jgi:crotonobetainyl-CoA:carnitine CoA-transferase CaiB-like acyl-CoA transferase